MTPAAGCGTRRPTFLILGAAKSATTALHAYLDRHPDISMSKPKEPLFFECAFEKGLQYYCQTYFKNWTMERQAGEARVVNLYLPYVPTRIQSLLPEAKLIAILRNPVDRAYAHWWMRRGWRGIEDLSFEDALRENLMRLRSGPQFVGALGEWQWCQGLDMRTGVQRYRSYIDMGYYAEQLERYYERFPTSQVKVILFSDLVQSRTETLRSLFEFLDVDPTFVVPGAAPENMSPGVLGRRLQAPARALGIAKVLPRSWISRSSRALRRFDTRPTLAPTTRRWLVEHYYEHNRRLERLIGRGLREWDLVGQNRFG